MKKTLAVILAAAMIASLTAGCGDNTKTEPTNTDSGKLIDALPAETTDIADSTADALAGKTTFTVGFDAEFPPYGYQDDNGEYVGFDLDLAEEVCKRNGWELVKKPIDWDSKDLELDTETIDCIWNGFTINGREDSYTWTEAYVDNSQVFVVAADSGIKTKADLAGKNVVVQADSSALAALTGDDATDENKALKDTFGELTEVADYNTAFMNLEAGAADAVAMDIGVAKYQISSRGDSFVMLDDVLAAEEYGVGFKKGNTALRDAVQKSLNEMADDGTFMKIAEKWELSDSVILGK
ncbi:MAG: amino acid ABC transporter substrate-binding protein [Clostridia bacterium]|nr:amino acid ABC transporter substrate-binding protein [Clostridia bacterium]